MTNKIIKSGKPLNGKAVIPGDKSISHRTLIFAFLAEGSSEIRGLSRGDDVKRTAAAIKNLGANLEHLLSSQDSNGDNVLITGGLSRVKEPTYPLDMGNSGTGLRLMAGVLSQFDFLSILIGDDSIHRRPMGRIVEPLRQMGARVDGRVNGTLAPLVIRGGGLQGIDYAPQVPSAQVKSSILLAGMGAKGTTVVREHTATRRHTEEMCQLLGLPVEVESVGQSLTVSLRACSVPPFKLDVPRDPSQAAFVAVAASIIEGSEVEIENVYLGPGRDGFLRVLLDMGANIEVHKRTDNTADLSVKSANLQGTVVTGQLLADSIDEVPVLAVAAAYATGETKFLDAGELRAKESDRLVAIEEGLLRLGVAAKIEGDNLFIEATGRVPGNLLTGEKIMCRSFHDHRIAMALSVATMAACNESASNQVTSELEIDDFDAVDTSWPGFIEAFATLQQN